MLLGVYNRINVGISQVAKHDPSKPINMHETVLLLLVK